MIIRDIKEITALAAMERKRNNLTLYKAYSYDTKKAQESPLYMRVSYQKLYRMRVEYSDGMFEDVQFGWRTRYLPTHAPDVMWSGSLPFLENNVNKRIELFCKKYRQAIFEGRPLEELMQKDPDHLLYYEPLPTKNASRKEKVKTFVKKYFDK